jgi:hypothetical protein
VARVTSSPTIRNLEEESSPILLAESSYERLSKQTLFRSEQKLAQKSPQTNVLTLIFSSCSRMLVKKCCKRLHLSLAGLKGPSALDLLPVVVLGEAKRVLSPAPRDPNAPGLQPPHRYSGKSPGSSDRVMSLCAPPHTAAHIRRGQCYKRPGVGGCLLS